MDKDLQKLYSQRDYLLHEDNTPMIDRPEVLERIAKALEDKKTYRGMKVHRNGQGDVSTLEFFE